MSFDIYNVHADDIILRTGSRPNSLYKIRIVRKIHEGVIVFRYMRDLSTAIAAKEGYRLIKRNTPEHTHYLYQLKNICKNLNNLSAPKIPLLNLIEKLLRVPETEYPTVTHRLKVGECLIGTHMSNETPVNNPRTENIVEHRTLVHGKNVEHMKQAQLLDLLMQLEAETRHLETYKTPSRAITKIKEDIRQAIKVVVTALDKTVPETDG